MALSEAKANGKLEKITAPSKKQPRKEGKFSHGGARAGGGRKKGVPNKITADIKTAIVEAFHEAGGVEYLKAVAKDNPQVFCTLIGKVLPLQVTGEGGGSIKVTWTDE